MWRWSRCGSVDGVRWWDGEMVLSGVCVGGRTDEVRRAAEWGVVAKGAVEGGGVG